MSLYYFSVLSRAPHVRFFLLTVLLVAFFAGRAPRTAGHPPLSLFYDQPALDWMTQALPIGNGYTGVMFFGWYDEERLQFSEGTLWEGGPGAGTDYNYGLRPGAADHVAPVRELVNQSRLQDAHEMAVRELTGIIHPLEEQSFGDYGSQQTMGDLYVRLPGQTEQVSGLRARGGFTVSINWVDGKVAGVHIEGEPGSQGNWRHNGVDRDFEITRSGVYKWNGGSS